MKIGELFMELGFHADTMKLNDFVRSIGELNMSSLIAGGSFAELVNIAKSLTEGTIGLARDMRFFGTETGMSAQKMQSWSQLAKQIGMDGKEIESSLRHLQMSIARTKAGEPDQGLLRAFSLLNQYGRANISINDNAFQIQEKIRNGLEKMTPEARLLVMQYAGLEQSMLNFYLMRKDLWATKDKQPVISPEEISRMAELQEEWSKLVQEITIAGNHFATELAPAMLGIVRTTYNMFKEINDSCIGKTLAMSTEGWGRIFGWAGVGLDNLTTNLAKFANNNFKENPGFAVPAQSLNLSASFTIHGNDPREIATHVHRSLKEWMAETHFQAPLRQY